MAGVKVYVFLGKVPRYVEISNTLPFRNLTKNHLNYNFQTEKFERVFPYSVGPTSDQASLSFVSEFGQIILNNVAGTSAVWTIVIPSENQLPMTPENFVVTDPTWTALKKVLDAIKTNASQEWSLETIFVYTETASVTPFDNGITGVKTFLNLPPSTNWTFCSTMAPNQYSIVKQTQPEHHFSYYGTSQSKKYTTLYMLAFMKLYIVSKYKNNNFKEVSEKDSILSKTVIILLATIIILFFVFIVSITRK